MRTKMFALAGLTLMAVGGAALAYATTGTTEEGYVCPATGETLPCPDCCPLNAKAAPTADCCEDPTCPPGCRPECPPDCKPAKPEAVKAEAKPRCADGCCPPAKPAAKATCPPCWLCP